MSQELNRVSSPDLDRRSWRGPAILAATAIGLLVVATTAGSLRDLDVFWHIRLGDELLGGVSIYDAGRDWSYAPVDYTWVSTQWIVEILFSWLNDAAGLTGLVGFRVVTTALALVSVLLVLLRDRQNRSWAILTTYLASAFTLFVFAQDRPQQVSFIVLPIVGWWWLRLVRDNRAPTWWVILLVCAIWANCHGLWIMVPVALALGIIGRILDHGWSDRCARTAGWSLLAAIVGGSLTPIGPLNLLVPLRFAETTGHIVEWNPTSFTSLVSIGLSAILILLAIAWARGRRRPTRSEVLFAIAIAIFGASAARNIAPAVLLLAPLLAWRLSVAFAGPPAREKSPALARISKPATGFLLAFGVLIGLAATAASDPIPTDSRPTDLVATIAAREEPSRVLNGYNVSGLVLWFARPEVSRDLVQVGIDGRADRYGAAYIDEYLAMERGEPGWNETITQLEPNIALLPSSAPVVELLTDRGWTEIGNQAEYVLLLPPGDG